MEIMSLGNCPHVIISFDHIPLSLTTYHSNHNKINMIIIHHCIYWCAELITVYVNV